MLILASASPRRQELLRNAGIPFVIQASNIREAVHDGEAPKACAERLAREKAIDVARNRPDDMVLGADTIVVVDGDVLGKPASAPDAVRMLKRLAGRSHQVITGVCLISAGGIQEVGSESTLVAMSAVNENDIHAYVESGEPMDKAGAYAIQGIASRWISRIEGDYFNVVGLPVALVWRMLRGKAALLEAQT